MRETLEKLVNALHGEPKSAPVEIAYREANGFLTSGGDVQAISVGSLNEALKNCPSEKMIHIDPQGQITLVDIESK